MKQKLWKNVDGKACRPREEGCVGHNNNNNKQKKIKTNKQTKIVRKR